LLRLQQKTGKKPSGLSETSIQREYWRWFAVGSRPIYSSPYFLFMYIVVCDILKMEDSPKLIYKLEGGDHMRSRLKHTVIIVLTICLLACANTGLVWGCEENAKNTAETGKKFKDLKEEHWAYQAISRMAERKIIGGYPDGTFKPDKVVTRDEFAKMMVLSLDLPEVKPELPTFRDIPRNYWAYVPIESAKLYLTGFRTTYGDYFRPGQDAVREDMAVALVKALGYADENVEDSVLNIFTDVEDISPNLRKYVKIAVKHNLMSGYPLPDSNKKMFKSQNSLTRAEAASLLFKVLQEEKITYETTQVPVPSNPTNPGASYPAVHVSGQVDGGKIVLKWEPVNSYLFQGYKIVISKNNSRPKYPEDGYLYYITDKNKTSAVINNSEPYKNGDFGSYLVSGEEYYFSVTAVYKDKKVPGNVISLTIP